MERKKKRKEAREERLGGEAEELSAKRRNSANFLPFRIRYAHRQHTVIVYFVLALRSAFRNELSYGAKTPIDTVCITAVCNDRRLRVCAMRSLSLPPSLSLALRCILRGNACAHCAHGHTRLACQWLKCKQQ